VVVLVAPANKYVGRADVTEGAYSYFLTAYCESEGWSSNKCLSVNVVTSNVMFTVPKNSQIDRCACKEPDGNMFMQKAVGDHIRSRLKQRCGIDLNDQSRNRSLAQQGAITGALATIDLSAASDSLTTGLCELLLPDLWFSLLMALRSPSTSIDGVLHVNEMMSSMGNGFTFEVESLLFCDQ